MLKSNTVLREYSCVGIYHPKSAINIGGILRNVFDLKTMIPYNCIPIAVEIMELNQISGV